MVSGNAARQGGPAPLSALIGKVLDPVCARRGLAGPALISAWAEIVGPRYAGSTMPERLSFPRGAGHEAGTLTLHVDKGAAIYVQHESDQLIERINGFLGFRAVARIKMVQRPIPKPAPKRPAPPRALAPAEEAALAAAVGGIADDSLRSSLAALGRAVMARARRHGEQTP